MHGGCVRKAWVGLHPLANTCRGLDAPASVGCIIYTKLKKFDSRSKMQLTQCNTHIAMRRTHVRMFVRNVTRAFTHANTHALTYVCMPARTPAHPHARTHTHTRDSSLFPRKRMSRPRTFDSGRPFIGRRSSTSSGRYRPSRRLAPRWTSPTSWDPHR